MRKATMIFENKTVEGKLYENDGYWYYRIYPIKSRKCVAQSYVNFKDKDKAIDRLLDDMELIDKEKANKL